MGTYSPLTLRNTGLADNFGVKVQMGFTAPVFQGDKMVNLQWDVKEDVPANANGMVTLQWNTADHGTSFSPAGPLIMGHYNGTIWEKQQVVASGSGPYMATGVNFNSFSPFVIGMDGALDNIALPITAVKLSATEQAGKVQLKWTSYNEVNLLNYTKEKAVDGNIFTPIGAANATNRSGTNDYSFPDPAINNGVTYYRLRITSKDGTITYSNIIVLNFRKGAELALLPNPVRNDLYITDRKACKNSVLTIIASNGVRVMNIPVAMESIQTTVNTSALPPGTYMLRFTNGGKTESKQFVRMK